MNQDRKSIEQGMQREALAQLKDLPVESMPFGLCLFDPEWHQGVIGILASRMKKRYFRPTIAFADAGDGLLKGSGRSVQGFHIRDALSVVAAQRVEPDRQVRWPRDGRWSDLAAGEFSAVRRAFDAEVRRQLREEDLTGRMLSDGTLAVEEFHLELARALRHAGPWGQHFRSRCFMACSSWSSSVWSANGI